MGAIITYASGLNDTVYGQSLFPIKTALQSQIEAFEKESIVDFLYVKETSKHFGEKKTSMGGMDEPKPVARGGDFPENDMAEGYSNQVEHQTWKDSFRIIREDWDDKQILAAKQPMMRFTQAWGRGRERFGIYTLCGATATSVNVGGVAFNTKGHDGVALFSTAHPPKVSGNNQSNLYDNAFSVTNLGLVETAMQNFKGERNEELAIAPDTIMIPNQAALKKAVFEAIGSNYDPSSVTNNSVWNYQVGRWTVIVNPYWVPATGSPWMLLSNEYNKAYECLNWYDRMPLTIKGEEAPNWDLLHKGMARRSIMFTDFRCVAMAGVSGGTTLA
ncbi:MAG: hypothetical protein EOM51_10300 [Clostridia bacterium]|nr:hypothetical protein [Clostridia bacterium]